MVPSRFQKERQAWFSVGLDFDAWIDRFSDRTYSQRRRVAMEAALILVRRFPDMPRDLVERNCWKLERTLTACASERAVQEAFYGKAA